MKLKKLVVAIAIVCIIVLTLSKEVLANIAVPVYNPISVFCANIMIIASIILGILYFVLAVKHLMKTMKEKTLIQQMGTLIIWLAITSIIIIALNYFSPIVREIGITYQGNSSFNKFKNR